MAKQVHKGSLTKLKVSPIQLLQHETPTLVSSQCECGFEGVGASVWERIKHWFRCL
jgi:hypothetical protein